MKKILLSVLLVLAVAPVLFAQRFNNVLKVRLSDNSPIKIRVDKQNYDETNRLLTIENLAPGRHRLKVFLDIPNSRNDKSLVYDGYLKITDNTMNYIIVDRAKGTVRVNTSNLEEQPVRINDRGVYPHDPIDKSKYGNGRDHDSRDRDHRYNSRSFSQSDMQDLKSRVADRSFDSDKLKLMQTALDNRMVTTEQVRQMLTWLSFESSKLKFAKWAYKNVTDGKNYWKIESEFDYSSTKNEFNDYINSNRR